MKNSSFRSIVSSLLITTFGSLLSLVFCYAAYLGVFLLTESIVFSDHPDAMPVDTIRQTYAILLFVLCLFLLHTKIPELLKAAVFTGPFATLMITSAVGNYNKPAMAVAMVLAIAGICIYLLYRFQKPWFYYYAAALSLIAAFFYSWPRP